MLATNIAWSHAALRYAPLGMTGNSELFSDIPPYPSFLFSQALLAWYDKEGRDLPWRVKGRAADPYRVWISEVMLQQTTVATVIPYFENFMRRWPTLEDFAHASIDEVLHAWQGLGYYTRARSLYACAQKILSEWHGQFPQTEKDLLTLPGIGPYTAAALLTIVFDQPAVAIDGNITRVMSRYRALSGIEGELRKKIEEEGKTLLPLSRFGDYTQALMDLGSRICTPKVPLCRQCPVKEGCIAYRENRVVEFPQKKIKRAQPVQHIHVFWVERTDGSVLFQKEERTRLLSGLMRPPMSSFYTQESSPDFPIKGSWKENSYPFTHVFTHFKLKVRLWSLTVSKDFEKIKGVWISPRQFHAHAFSRLVQKMIQAMEKEKNAMCRRLF